MDESIIKRKGFICIIKNLDAALQECNKLSDDFEEFGLLCKKIEKLLAEASDKMLKI